MCGIFGIIVAQNSGFPLKMIENCVDNLFILSESRGKEASGIAVKRNDKICVLKMPLISSKFIKSDEYRKICKNQTGDGDYSPQKLNGPMAIIGHSRLVTNGAGWINSNNQPVIKDGAVGIHNGIIVNDLELWNRFCTLKKEFDVDTEVFLGILQFYRGENASIVEAVRNTYQNIKGCASVCVLFDDSENILLATNSGSLYFFEDINGKFLIFASEKYIIERLLTKNPLRRLIDGSHNNITQIKPYSGYIIKATTLEKNEFVFDSKNTEVSTFLAHKRTVENQNSGLADDPGNGSNKTNIQDLSHYDPMPKTNIRHVLTEKIRKSMLANWDEIYSESTPIQRCNKCLLPSTTPFITFDAEGTCNYCRNYENKGKPGLKGEEALRNFVAKYRSASGEPDCIVGFSGGRDSAYALDYIKNRLGMNPIAFTYDWGMLTDLGRRNQSKICSELGVENILVSADITLKRKNIQRNINAWLKKPELGMVPLLMAGDKQFYHYFHEIRKQTGVKLFIFAGGHISEEDPFKYGFCGIKHGTNSLIDRITKVSIADKLMLISYAFRNYLSNPSYINLSLFDTIYAFYCTYLIPDDYLYLFEFIEWDEENVISTIRNKFDWELAKDTIATWPFDDGTAPFYNYIYLTMAGFTEFDHFRSTQIRDGLISRARGLELIREENKPRFEAIEWYADAVNFDCNRAIEVINAAPKLYRR